MKLSLLFIPCLAVLAIGCAKESTVIKSGDGGQVTIESDKDSGTVTMSGKDGETSFSAGNDVTEAELGLPFYPGSKAKPGSDFRAEADGEKSVLSVRTTSDDPERVAEFYQNKVKGLSLSSYGEGKDKIYMLDGRTMEGMRLSIQLVKNKPGDDWLINVATSVKAKK